MITCQEVTRLVTDFLEGRMSFWARVRFRLHLGMCRACRNFIRQMRHAIKTLGRLPDDPIPPELEEELLERFRKWKG